MTTFQNISVIFSAIVLLGGIVGVYIKTAICIARIEVEIVNLKHDLQLKEIAIVNLENRNREDHKEIIAKIDNLIMQDK